MAEDDLKRLIESTAAETRRAFDITAERIGKETRDPMEIFTESVKVEVKLVAESVPVLRGDMTRELSQLRQEMTRSFDDTKAMIKFSHAELDRRVRVLEHDVTDL